MTKPELHIVSDRREDGPYIVEDEIRELTPAAMDALRRVVVNVDQRFLCYSTPKLTEEQIEEILRKDETC